jgi:hypothetical protein
MTDYEPDDGMSEAAAARHERPGRPKYQEKPDDVTLRVRLDAET